MNRKISTIFAVSVIIIIAGFFVLVLWLNNKKDNDQSQSLTFQTSYNNPNNQYQTNTNDASCQKDEDCIMAMTECSCDCGKPINKIHWQKYLDAQEKKCKNYKGRMCDMKCDFKLKCINNLCRIEDKSNLACNTDEECWEKLPYCKMKNQLLGVNALCIDNVCKCECAERNSEGKIVQQLCE